jgi:hypothetical protein
LNPSRQRKLAALLLFAWIAAHPATRAPLLLALLSFGHDHPGGHSYSLSLAEDASHFDLVLSHADAAGHEHGDSPGCSEGDHVVHLCGDLALREAGRRHDPGAAPVLGSWAALPAVPGRDAPRLGRGAQQDPEPVLRRSVVLRC